MLWKSHGFVLDMSRSCRRGESLCLPQPVSSRDGVGGMTRRNIPRFPSPRDIPPYITSSMFTAYFYSLRLISTIW